MDCNKSFIKEKELHKHNQIHNGEKPFQCIFCHKQFRKIVCRNKHQNNHCKKRENNR